MSEVGPGACTIATAIRDGRTSALAVADTTLARIIREGGQTNAFTAVTADRARGEARAIDARRARGEPLPPLAGVPYAAKNLFDIAGLTTIAGSRLLAERPPADADSALVARLHEAGAVMTGALNMDEFAYGFTTENAHYGACRNPYDVTRVAGGSSGGSAAAVAAGLVALSLATDTNGSIRVPASLCGVFGIKPTYGRLSRRGSYPFVASLDHVGPMARSVADLAACYDALQGHDHGDPACVPRPIEPVSGLLDAGIAGLRFARLGGYFDRWADDEARAASASVADALGTASDVELPEVERARAAAFLITASEGGNLHLPQLRCRAADFDPATRDRLTAGALAPATWTIQAQRLRSWFRARALALLRQFDVLIAPATPCVAPRLGQTTLSLAGETLPLRPSLGLLTQPISFIGLPVIAAPVRRQSLPLGVQLVAAPWREEALFRVAGWLERQGVVAYTAP